MEYIENTLEILNKLILLNNTLVKKGSSDSLESKFFYITNKMENYIKQVVNHNKESILKKLDNKDELNVLDLFAGSGMFTLMYSKYLLLLLQNENKIISKLTIILNDLLNENRRIENNSKYLNLNSLAESYYEIYKNYERYNNLIRISSYDLRLIGEYDIDNFSLFLNENSLNIIVANPMITKTKKTKKESKINSLIYTSEEELLNNTTFQTIINKVLDKSDFFIYLNKQETSSLRIPSHKKIIKYVNDYNNLVITKLEKERYELFKFNNLDVMKKKNFWLLNDNQKEDFNNIYIFEKSDLTNESEYKYVYDEIYDINKEEDIQYTIEEIKTNLNNITLDDIIRKYNALKEQL